MVLQLEEPETERLRAGEGGEARPELVEEDARGKVAVHAVAESALEPGLRLAEDGVDEHLLALEEPVERPPADPRALHHGWNGRSMVAPLGEQLERGVENTRGDGFSTRVRRRNGLGGDRHVE